MRGGEGLEYLDALYRVAFFLLLNCKAAEQAVETTYRRASRLRGRNLKIELLQCLLEIVESIECAPHYGEIETSDVLLIDCVSRLPRRLRIVMLLEAVGCDVEEIAAIIRLPVAAVLRRQSAAWECCLRPGCTPGRQNSAGRLAASSPPCGTGGPWV